MDPSLFDWRGDGRARVEREGWCEIFDGVDGVVGWRCWLGDAAGGWEEDFELGGRLECCLILRDRRSIPTMMESHPLIWLSRAHARCTSNFMCYVACRPRFDTAQAQALSADHAAVRRCSVSISISIAVFFHRRITVLLHWRVTSFLIIVLSSPLRPARTKRILCPTARRRC